MSLRVNWVAVCTVGSVVGVSVPTAYVAVDTMRIAERVVAVVINIFLSFVFILF